MFSDLLTTHVMITALNDYSWILSLKVVPPSDAAVDMTANMVFSLQELPLAAVAVPLVALVAPVVRRLEAVLPLTTMPDVNHKYDKVLF